MKRGLAAAAVAILMAGGLFAQASLTKSAKLPTVDGSFGAAEYQFKTTVSGMTIGATLGSDDLLYLAVQAPTEGWAALGVGGLVMNGSRLFLGAIQDGKSAFIEKTGKGHFYVDAPSLVVKKWVVKTSGGSTVLELSLPSSAAINNGKLDLLFAYARVPSFVTQHAARGSLSIAIK